MWLTIASLSLFKPIPVFVLRFSSLSTMLIDHDISISNEMVQSVKSVTHVFHEGPGPSKSFNLNLLPSSHPF